MRYNRGCIQSTGKAAMKLAAATSSVQYVVALAGGFTIQNKPADFDRRCKATDGQKVWTVGTK